MIAQIDFRSFYEFQPVLPTSQAWQILLWIVGILVIFASVWWLYRRDWTGLPRGVATTLVTLRILTLVLVLVFALGLGKRSETKIVKNSRLVVLIDTSLSMGLRDLSANRRQTESQTPSRIDQVLRWLTADPQLDTLRRDHDVAVYQFGDTAQPQSIAQFPKLKSDSTPAANTSLDQLRSANERRDYQVSQQIGWIAVGLAILTIVCGIVWIWTRWTSRASTTQAWSLCFWVSSFFVCLLSLACCDLKTPQSDLWTSLGWRQLSLAPIANLENEPTNADVTAPEIQWQQQLNPQSTSTQMGTAIQQIINQERGGPIAGIILVTDGGSNAGVQPARAMAAAANARVPVFPVGIGSAEMPRSIQVADLQVPQRVFPSDRFQLKTIIKSSGLEGQMVRIELVSVDPAQQEAETMEADTKIRIPDDGEAVPLEFDLVCETQGKRRYVMRTENIEGDLDLRDNQRSAVVDVVERKTKVLLIAGGPNREFRFLRNQLFRDKEILLHVWLQSSKSGADQEADVLLDSFPETREEIFSYDCVIAFDPDWRILTIPQTNLLERWVAEQAGGMIVVAGPVNTPEWTRQPRGNQSIDKIRRLYPVSFYSQGTAQLKLGRFGGDESFPLKFSREGRAAEFLWLGDTSSQSQTNWDRFSGVFGYYSVNEPKPGADILANFADPATAIDDQLPIYLANHFYGAGRVFFQASGEMWRIRRLDVGFFQAYYTKLIRWASQGRLLRDSTQGVLLTDRERCWVGDSISLQAILNDPNGQPFLMDEVLATILEPDGTSRSLTLQTSPNSVRVGTFVGQLIATKEGEYRVSLPIPGSPNLEVLTTTIEASIPDLEKEFPQRNDKLLTQLAEQTGGHYYVGLDEFMGDQDSETSPQNLIVPQNQETFLTGTLDRFFHRKLMMWLLGIMVSALTIEWVTRRLHKLS